jgi:hypothetical protein
MAIPLRSPATELSACDAWRRCHGPTPTRRDQVGARRDVADEQGAQIADYVPVKRTDLQARIHAEGPFWRPLSRTVAVALTRVLTYVVTVMAGYLGT